jgi:predicted TIM-barrel fold metal-dependent hydrolase
MDVFNNYILHKSMELAGKHNFVVSAHSGVWNDFRDLDPKHLLGLALEYPNTNFDLYHLGFPFIRDTIMIAKNNKNVYLNLCWTHVLSESQTQSAIKEMLDLVPLNKISAFGGDYVSQVEKIVGHLSLAKENFAKVFAKEIEDGRFAFDEGVRILKQFFYDNPMNLYNLKNTINN